MKDKALQFFSDEYLSATKNLSTEQILTFQENFRKLHGPKKESSKSKLISMKVPHGLLETFKARAKLEKIPYQTMIKQLMKNWLGVE